MIPFDPWGVLTILSRCKRCASRCGLVLRHGACPERRVWHVRSLGYLAVMVSGPFRTHHFTLMKHAPGWTSLASSHWTLASTRSRDRSRWLTAHLVSVICSRLTEEGGQLFFPFSLSISSPLYIYLYHSSLSLYLSISFCLA